mgnify:CR=1 FL=1
MRWAWLIGGVGLMLAWAACVPRSWAMPSTVVKGLTQIHCRSSRVFVQSMRHWAVVDTGGMLSHKNRRRERVSYDANR